MLGIPKTTTDKIDLYRRATDEYHALYIAFMRSGFGAEQAFELVKAHCTSIQTQNLFEAVNKEYRRRDYTRGYLKKEAEKNE